VKKIIFELSPKALRNFFSQPDRPNGGVVGLDESLSDEEGGGSSGGPAQGINQIQKMGSSKIK